jgi:type IV pilus assembly protein PilM
MGKKQHTHIEVLLAATKKSYVDEYINIINASDLNVKVMDVYSCVIGRLTVNTVPKQLNEDVENKVIAMIDIGHDILTVSIFKNEKQLYLKEQNFGGKLLNELIQKEHSVDYKLAENLKLKHADPAIVKIITVFSNQLAMQVYHMLQFFYASAISEKIDFAFAFGGCAKLPNLTTEIQNKIEIPVKVLNPFAGINTSKYKEDKNFIENDTTLAVACGLALRSYIE